MDTELILAIVGIAFAVVALGALSVVQQARLKREKRAKQEKARDAKRPPAAALGAFFVARYRGNKARFFRVYDDDDAFLFVSVGPYLVLIDAEPARGTEGRHWAAQSAKLLAAALAVGVGAAAAVVGVGRWLAPNAGNNPEGLGAALYLVIGLVGLLALGLAVALPAVVWRITRRAAELDAMSPEELRVQAETDELSFRANHASIFDIKFALLDVGGDRVGATLTFRHKATGNWRLETTTTGDTRDAIAAFIDSFGDELVHVEEALAEKLGWPRPEE